MMYQDNYGRILHSDEIGDLSPHEIEEMGIYGHDDSCLW